MSKAAVLTLPFTVPVLTAMLRLVPHGSFPDAHGPRYFGSVCMCDTPLTVCSGFTLQVH